MSPQLVICKRCQIGDGRLESEDRLYLEAILDWRPRIALDGKEFHLDFHLSKFPSSGDVASLCFT